MTEPVVREPEKPRRFLEPEQWKKAAREAGEAARAEGRELNPRELDPLYKRLPAFEVREPEDVEEERVLRFSITTADVDRDRDTINVDGWDLSNYRMNPVVLFVHDYKQLPVARSLKEWLEDGKLKSDAQFVDKDTYPFGHTVYQMYKLGFMRAVSVGFLPTKWSWVEDDDRPYGVDFQEQELLEYSAVPVPSNPYALQEAAKKGVDTEPLREWAYDVLGRDPSGLWVPKAAIEEMKRVLDGEHRQFNFPKAKLAENEALPPTQEAPDEPCSEAEPAEGSDKGGTPEDGQKGSTELASPGGPDPMQETYAARLVQMIAVLRARDLGVEISVEPETSLLNTRLPTHRLTRQANYLAAKLMPEIDAETFERLFPELVGGESEKARSLAAISPEKLRQIRDLADEMLGETEEESGSPGEGGEEDGEILDFLEPAEALSDEEAGEDSLEALLGGWNSG